MFISTVHLTGFRNFKDATIGLHEKSLVIGSNEVGKSNLLHSLRILLDKSLSLAELEPQDSDFFAHEVTHVIRILVKFEEVKEECVLAKLREHVSDDGILYLAYEATRSLESGKKSFRFLVGRSANTLQDIETNRYYLKVLNLKFVSSNRDLASFIRRERRNLLQDARGGRTDQEIDQDSQTLATIETSLDAVNQSISSLSYVAKATQGLNAELLELSVLNEGQQITFDTGGSDPAQFVDNLRLAARIGEKSLPVGGDGRNNQIHLALWAARNKPIAAGDEPLEVCIFCIEEPEAHLHPHQQRKLASYLADKLQTQVIITTHSPQITCVFPPASIIRLYDFHPGTIAASGGSSPIIEDALTTFGHRLNIVPAETFFSNAVLLVEGNSEELFYKALAQKLDIDLDRLNISIMVVDGVGFAPYGSLLQSLAIPFVIRTDNDVFQVPKKSEYRCAGVQRAIQLYRDLYANDPSITKTLEDNEDKLKGFITQDPPLETLEAVQAIRDALESVGLFLANRDLETDLKNSSLSTEIAAYLENIEEDGLIHEMQKRKATFMFDFLRQNATALVRLEGDPITKPLLRCVEIASLQEVAQ